MSESNGSVGAAALKEFASQRRYDNVSVPGLGDVRIRSISSYEDGLREASQLDENGQIDLHEYPLAKARLIALSVVNDNGDREFADADDEMIAEWQSDVVNRIFSACRTLSGLDLEPLEDTAKNSEEIAADALQSG
jgi:hypothetical protein